MKYIVCKKFNKKGIDKDFSLVRGSTCIEKDGVITHNDEKICFSSSQNAYDFFSRNDDGKGYERFALINEIKEIIYDYVVDYNEKRATALSSLSENATEEEINHALSSIEDKCTKAYNICRQDSNTKDLLKVNDNIWNFNFYNANIETLQYLKELISEC